MFKLIIQNIVTIFIPSVLKVKILNLMGHSISNKAKIGSVILGSNTKLNLQNGAIIGAFNLLSCQSLTLKSNAFIRRFNTFQGGFSVELNEGASVGNFNRFVNSATSFEGSISNFYLGKFSNLTSKHYFDMTANITICDNSVIGGIGSQFWTHGFQHFNLGKDRLRVDGAIFIGNGVYIGSRSLLSPGVILGDEVSIGAGAIVSKSLNTKKLYVSQPLRSIEVSMENFLDRYSKVESGKTAKYVKK